MRRLALPVLLVGSLLSVALFGPARAAMARAFPAASPQAFGGIVQEPVVVYNLTGGTLSGLLHRQLTVYNNGFATLAKFDQPVFPTPGEIKDVSYTYVSPDEATQLLLDLVAAGAVTLPDQSIPFSDVPLQTLTLLEGKELALSRTFSWWLGFEYGGVSQVIGAFLSKHFPEL